MSQLLSKTTNTFQTIQGQSKHAELEESKSNNDLNEQEQHKINAPNGISEEYWYELKFKEASKAEQRKCLDMLRLTDYKRPLAYFLFKNPQLSIITRVKYIKTYDKLTKGPDKFDLNEIRSRLIELDKKKIQNKELSTREWRRIKAIANTATGYDKQIIPDIEFTADTKESVSEESIDMEFVKDLYVKLKQKQMFKEA